jgi:hypothetical protein
MKLFNRWGLNLFFFFLLGAVSFKGAAQAELAPWGNLSGIRRGGQLMEFQTGLQVVKDKGSEVQSSGKEKQRPKYERRGQTQVVQTTIGRFSFTEEVTDRADGSVSVKVRTEAMDNDTPVGVYFSIELSHSIYAGATFRADGKKAVPLNSVQEIEKLLRQPLRNLRISSPQRQLVITLDEPAVLLVNSNAGKNGVVQFRIPVHTGTVAKGSVAEKTIFLDARGVVNTRMVTVAIDASKEGRAFDGLGGNFRLQNPKTDPQVIEYSLSNLRVAWGRVEMPWRFWQVSINDQPMDSARAGKLHPRVQAAMEMAQRLYRLGMPVILSAWSAPDWAIVGPARFNPGPDGVWGNPLESSRMQQIYRSIGDYVAVLKEQYGVETSMFSFNESDLGIYIRQTGAEHAALIKGLGAYFVQRGLKTRLLLGDNSDATTYAFIEPAMADTSTHSYIGAVSFHSWRGWEQEILQKWADAATRINRPLIVGEGSIDAQAWGYPAIFEEPSYALQEINLYTRLLNICQPASILQWQLTADYSPMAGGGIFGNNEPLRPTQRFWNLKQLASTPPGLKALAARSNRSDVSVAALGDRVKNLYTIHMVNNGPARKVAITGLPASVKSLNVFVTDRKKAMKQVKTVVVVQGKASLVLESLAYTTLTNQ